MLRFDHGVETYTLLRVRSYEARAVHGRGEKSLESYRAIRGGRGEGRGGGCVVGRRGRYEGFRRDQQQQEDREAGSGGGAVVPPKF